MAKNGITAEKLANAPSEAEAAQKFLEKFGYDVMLAAWVLFLDIGFLRRIFKSAHLAWQYDYHYFDIWPVAWVYLLQNNYQGSINSEPIFQTFGLPKRGHHDALADCRLAAEVLRKLMNQQKHGA